MQHTASDGCGGCFGHTVSSCLKCHRAGSLNRLLVMVLRSPTLSLSAISTIHTHLDHLGEGRGADSSRSLCCCTLLGPGILIPLIELTVPAKKLSCNQPAPAISFLLHTTISLCTECGCYQTDIFMSPVAQSHVAAAPSSPVTPLADAQNAYAGTFKERRCRKDVSSNGALMYIVPYIY